MGYGMALNSLQAVIDGLRNQGGTFARTPKQGNDGKKSKATVKAYKETRYPWGELFFLTVSVGVILFGNVANPFFYLTHLFYASCYTLMIYFFYRSHLDEQATQSSSIEEDNISNDSAPHVEISMENSNAKPIKGKSNGFAARTLGQLGFILFLVILGRSVVSRFPYMADESSNHILGYIYRHNLNLNKIPDQVYSSCPSDAKVDEEVIKYSFSEWDETNYFSMDCKTYPYAYKIASSFNWKEYFQPIRVKDEYIIARCGNKLQFHVKNRVNSTTINRSSYIRSIVDQEEQTSSLDDENKKLNGRANLLVLIIDGTPSNLKNFDSLSKSSSFLQYLNEFGSLNAFSFNNFKPSGLRDGSNEIALTSGCGIVTTDTSNHHSIVSDDYHFPYQSTDSNLLFEYHRSTDVSMLCPTKSAKRSMDENDDSDSEVQSTEDININEMPDLWMWNKYQKLGYATLYGDETCLTRQSSPYYQKKANYGIGAGATQFFNKKGGLRNDHIYGVHTCERYFAPKCYGSKYLHNDTFTYLNDFWNNYKNRDINRMAWVHLDSTVGKDVQKDLLILDSQLSEFLENFYNEDNGNRDTIVAIIGSPSTLASNKEDVTSFVRLILPSTFVNQHSIFNTLASNQHRLITSYDMYSSFSSLLKMMYPQSANFKSADPSWSYNIFTDSIPASRNCEDARLPANLCK